MAVTGHVAQETLSQILTAGKTPSIRNIDLGTASVIGGVLAVTDFVSWGHLTHYPLAAPCDTYLCFCCWGCVSCCWFCLMRAFNSPPLAASCDMVPSVPTCVNGHLSLSSLNEPNAIHGLFPGLLISTRFLLMSLGTHWYQNGQGSKYQIHLKE